MALTAKQEAFAQAVANGAKLIHAYRAHYNPSPNADPATAYEEASRLAASPNISTRIDELRREAEEVARQHRAWNIERYLDEAETNLHLARSGGWRGASSANGALEIIGRATGLLADQQPAALPPITRVVVVLHPGKSEDSSERLVEAEYKVLDDGAGTKTVS